MSSITASSITISRPKVHRLPVNKPAILPEKNISFKWLVVGTAIVGISAVMLFSKDQSIDNNKINTSKAAIVPSISVSPQAGAVSDASIIGDAQAAIPVIAHKGSGIISLHNDSDHIVGQMAKIPVESEQITEVLPTNNIDNHAGRELLSILSKY